MYTERSGLTKEENYLLLTLAKKQPVNHHHLKSKMKNKSFILSLLLCGIALSLEAAPRTLCSQAQGIVLYGESAPHLKTKELSQVRGLQIIDLKLPGPIDPLKKELYAILDAGPITVDTISQLQESIKQYYADYSHPFVVVQIPKQDVTDCVLQMDVIESHVGAVSVVGNEWFSSNLMKTFVGLKPGDEIDQAKLAQNLYFINQDPFVQADLIFAPGTTKYTTDVTIAVKERRSIRLYAGVDNTGIESVGRNRWFMGVNWGNAFGLGHLLSYQYTASFNRDQFEGITAQYQAPLTWHHILNIYGGYSRVHPHLHIPTVRNTGWSWQASLRYQIPLCVSNHLQHDFFVGGDFKRTNNTFEFSDETPTSGRTVNLTQVMAEYKGNYVNNDYALDFDGSLFYSPGSWIPDQSNADYRSLRAGAKHTWVYFRGAFSYFQKMPRDWSFYMLTRGQISSQNLLPSEQYGIGGYDTVRGYEERQLNKDTAVLATIEFRSPRLPVIGSWCSKCKDGIQFLAFADYGWGTNHKADLPTFKANYLAGVGPGIRYFYNSYLTARLDVGYKLRKKSYYNGGPAMVHFSVIGSY